MRRAPSSSWSPSAEACGADCRILGEAARREAGHRARHARARHQRAAGLSSDPRAASCRRHLARGASGATCTWCSSCRVARGSRSCRAAARWPTAVSGCRGRRKARASTDVTEDVIREVALPLGLVDTKSAPSVMSGRACSWCAARARMASCRVMNRDRRRRHRRHGVGIGACTTPASTMSISTNRAGLQGAGSRHQRAAPRRPRARGARSARRATPRAFRPTSFAYYSKHGRQRIWGEPRARRRSVAAVSSIAGAPADPPSRRARSARPGRLHAGHHLVGFGQESGACVCSGVCSIAEPARRPGASSQGCSSPATDPLSSAPDALSRRRSAQVERRDHGAGSPRPAVLGRTMIMAGHFAAGWSRIQSRSNTRIADGRSSTGWPSSRPAARPMPRQDWEHTRAWRKCSKPFAGDTFDFSTCLRSSKEPARSFVPPWWIASLFPPGTSGG